MRRPPLAAAGAEERAIVGEVPVHGEPLDAGALRDRADRRAQGAELAVEIDGRIDDALPRLRLAERPLLELVFPRHRDSVNAILFI